MLNESLFMKNCFRLEESQLHIRRTKKNKKSVLKVRVRVRVSFCHIIPITLIITRADKKSIRIIATPVLS